MYTVIVQMGNNNTALGALAVTSGIGIAGYIIYQDKVPWEKQYSHIPQSIKLNYHGWKGRFQIHSWKLNCLKFAGSCHGGLTLVPIPNKNRHTPVPLLIDLNIHNQHWTVRVREYITSRNSDYASSTKLAVQTSRGDLTLDTLVFILYDVAKEFGKWNYITNNCLHFRKRVITRLMC